MDRKALVIAGVCACGALAACGGGSVAGGAQRPTAVTPTAQRAAVPQSRPATIAFTALVGNVQHIWLMNVDTGSRRRLTGGRYGEEAASWSPDGARMVYADIRQVRMPGLSAPQITPLISVRDMSSGRVNAITSGRNFEETPAWSPTGKRIAFARTIIPTGSATSYPEIWTVAPNGTGARRLTHNSLTEMAPAWSPDGRLIAYQREARANSNSWDIWVMRADGAAQHRLVQNGTRPAFSPDGRRIAFGAPTGSVRGCCLVTNLTVIDADGSHRRVLVKDGGRPAWSPDGRRMVFQRIPGGRPELWIVNADGSGLRRLSGSRGQEYAAAWKPR